MYICTVDDGNEVYDRFWGSHRCSHVKRRYWCHFVNSRVERTRSRKVEQFLVCSFLFLFLTNPVGV